MGAIVPSTNVVAGSEPCFELAEVNRVLPIAGDGLRRMQVVRVIRNDQMWEWQRDLGPARLFKTEQFAFPGAVSLGRGRYEVLETVERLQAAADEFRARYDKPADRPFEPPNFVKLFKEDSARRHDARVGRRRFAIGGRAWSRSN